MAPIALSSGIISSSGDGREASKCYGQQWRKTRKNHIRASQCQGRCSVIGDVFVDVMAKVRTLPVWDADVEADFVKVLPGGSALNIARHLHALGTDVRFQGPIGGDSFGKMLLTHVSEQGFPTGYFKTFADLPTSACLILSGPQDRAMASCYSTTAALSAEDLEAGSSAREGCTHMHIGGYFNMTNLMSSRFTDLVKRCREDKMTISLNTQYDAAELWTGTAGHLHELLLHVDVLFVNAAEGHGIASALGGPKSEASIQDLCNAFPELIVVMTQGAKGCEVVCAGRPILHVPTTPLEKFVDATGAGDAFCAGFLSAWIANPDRSAIALEAACLKGHHTASICVGREGACEPPVSAADLQSRHKP